MRTKRSEPWRRIGLVLAGACALTAVGFAVLPALAKPKSSGVLKEAKLNIEHNATDHDTGFQGAVDSEGWQSLDLIGPNGAVLRIDGKGALGELGLTELFFETVEPENAEVPIDELLANLPAGTYTYQARGMVNGESTGIELGSALLSHAIPAGPVLQSPAEGATVPADELAVRWGAVTQGLRGGAVNVIAYQLIVEKDVPVHPHMIGKLGLSMYLPASTTSMTIARGFLEPNTAYNWEVLAIEESGNQTLSSGKFRTW